MTKKGFIQQSNDAVTLQGVIGVLNDAGVQTKDIVIFEGGIDEILTHVENGDEIFIYSFIDVATSLSDVFRTIEQINEAGAKLQSIKDEWINNISEAEIKVMNELNALNSEIISKRTRTSLKKLQDQGIKLGRRKGSKSTKYKSSGRPRKPRTPKAEVEVTEQE